MTENQPEAPTSARAAKRQQTVEKEGGQKIGPRNTSTPKKKLKQVRLPFDGGSSAVQGRVVNSSGIGETR